ncbi:uroporphyrinogen decarboxylase [Rhodoblastus acidophilus]|uniref:Uroporphyrinogen decarboxylase n=1 Tax=Candidatus Rhodoblastus alkanivorans TaxID=2954117 RepID=A0ABS9Z1N9_9HYPH|nr:uroporphyrinogen decarboxylase [Candidatus Rhodoblastus alkanivorans]
MLTPHQLFSRRLSQIRPAIRYALCALWNKAIPLSKNKNKIQKLFRISLVNPQSDHLPPLVSKKPLLAVLDGSRTTSPPIWLMRQAGRYLPEYREIRAKAPSFLDFCYSPAFAAEATLQPIRRFGFDAAILFSDILVVPDALGQKVVFETGEGPRLDPLTDTAAIRNLPPLSLERLAPVFETIDRVRAQLPAETTFLGFCGAPWTVASYMVAGRGSADQAAARLFAYRDPDGFQILIDKLVDASIEYLCAQFHAGVDAVQIFDSWAGILPAAEFERWSLTPITKIIQGVRKRVPYARIIAFPRGAASHYRDFCRRAGANALGLDTAVDPAWIAANVPENVVVQGHLDPLALLAGGTGQTTAVAGILEAYRTRAHIFNLGHGILPETPIDHVAALVKQVRSFEA